MSCDVSPIISTPSGSASSSCISSRSIAGCGLGVVSSAQREAAKSRRTPVASSERSRPLRLLPVAIERILSIATGKSRKGLERSLEATGVRRLFAASRCADETTPKPHPAMLLELMQELEAEPDGVLMIGDTSHDMEMARAAGVDGLAVTYGAHPEHQLRSCGRRGCVASVAALDRWLSRNG